MAVSLASRSLYLEDRETGELGQQAHAQFAVSQFLNAASWIACLITLGVIYLRLRHGGARFGGGQHAHEQIIALVIIHQFLDCTSVFLDLDPTSQQYDEDDKPLVRQQISCGGFLHAYSSIVTNAMISLLVFAVVYVIIIRRPLAVEKILLPYFLTFAIFGVIVGCLQVATKNRLEEASSYAVRSSRTLILAKVRNIYLIIQVFIQGLCVCLAAFKVCRSSSSTTSMISGNGSRHHQALVEVVKRFALYPLFSSLIKLPLIWYVLDPAQNTDDYQWSAEAEANDILYYVLPQLAGLLYSIVFFVQKPAAWSLMKSLVETHFSRRATIHDLVAAAESDLQKLPVNVYKRLGDKDLFQNVCELPNASKEEPPVAPAGEEGFVDSAGNIELIVATLQSNPIHLSATTLNVESVPSDQKRRATSRLPTPSPSFHSP